MKISQKLAGIIKRIQDAEKKYNRLPGAVTLLAVSKTKPATLVAEAVAAGQYDFGENYLQEAVTKIDALKNLKITWHFIGRIQSNKCREISKNFSWVHTVASVKAAKRLSSFRMNEPGKLNVCIQINISGESGKSGCKDDEVFPLAEYIRGLPKLKLRGLMAIPEPKDDFAGQRYSFARVKHIFTNLKEKGFELDTLSMGMSNDLEAAIAEGATIVRVGTAIFGERKNL